MSYTISTYKIDDTASQAYEGVDADGVFNNDDGEFSGADYISISVDDANAVNDITFTSNKYQYHRFVTTIAESVGDIKSITFTWKGYGRDTVQAKYLTGASLWVKNETAGTYTEYDSHAAGTKQTLTTTSSDSDVVAEWVDGTTIYWAAQCDVMASFPAFTSSLFSYYGEVVVEHIGDTSVHIYGGNLCQ